MKPHSNGVDNENEPIGVFLEALASLAIDRLPIACPILRFSKHTHTKRPLAILLFFCVQDDLVAQRQKMAALRHLIQHFDVNNYIKQ